MQVQVEVRQCIVNEFSTDNGTLCQPCPITYYNVDASLPCLPCPDNAVCARPSPAALEAEVRHSGIIPFVPLGQNQDGVLGSSVLPVSRGHLEMIIEHVTGYL